jgi:hypothetical protein
MYKAESVPEASKPHVRPRMAGLGSDFVIANIDTGRTRALKSRAGEWDQKMGPCLGRLMATPGALRAAQAT